MNHTNKYISYKNIYGKIEGKQTDIPLTVLKLWLMSNDILRDFLGPCVKVFGFVKKKFTKVSNNFVPYICI